MKRRLLYLLRVWGVIPCPETHLLPPYGERGYWTRCPVGFPDGWSSCEWRP